MRANSLGIPTAVFVIRLSHFPYPILRVECSIFAILEEAAFDYYQINLQANITQA
ncbi:hypothetical protein LV92_03222 [Arenibacter echinorum]|uniref:Uncharacterized protein n=1 Tax=Arenibacter echinorum TaxID=440515 RepID=A0A327QZC5_9FLAO|nr:hypothetical protein LV92_03222 [Arenibacter echinorum]